MKFLRRPLTISVSEFLDSTVFLIGSIEMSPLHPVSPGIVDLAAIEAYDQLTVPRTEV